MRPIFQLIQIYLVNLVRFIKQLHINYINQIFFTVAIDNITRKWHIKLVTKMLIHIEKISVSFSSKKTKTFNPLIEDLTGELLIL